MDLFPSTRLEPHGRMDTKATEEESVDTCRVLIPDIDNGESCEHTESKRGILYHSMLVL